MKHYTPKIEEFYIGFEFEFQGVDKNWNLTGWDKVKVNYNDPFNLYTLEHLKKCFEGEEKVENHIRVKYLDKTDIEGVLKTRQLKGDEVELNFQVIKSEYEFYEFDYDLDDKILTVEGWYQPKLVATKLGEYNCYTLFHGTVKNKSELKRILTDNLGLEL